MNKYELKTDIDFVPERTPPSTAKLLYTTKGYPYKNWEEKDSRGRTWEFCQAVSLPKKRRTLNF